MPNDNAGQPATRCKSEKKKLVAKELKRRCGWKSTHLLVVLTYFLGMFALGVRADRVIRLARQPLENSDVLVRVNCQTLEFQGPESELGPFLFPPFFVFPPPFLFFPLLSSLACLLIRSVQPAARSDILPVLPTLLHIVTGHGQMLHACTAAASGPDKQENLLFEIQIMHYDHTMHAPSPPPRLPFRKFQFREADRLCTRDQRQSVHTYIGRYRLTLLDGPRGRDRGLRSNICPDGGYPPLPFLMCMFLVHLSVR